MKWSFEIIQKLYITTKYGVLSKFYNVIDVHLHKDTNMKQLDINDCHSLFYF
jgi:hypothetical protein